MRRAESLSKSWEATTSLRVIDHCSHQTVGAWTRDTKTTQQVTHNQSSSSCTCVNIQPSSTAAKPQTATHSRWSSSILLFPILLLQPCLSVASPPSGDAAPAQAGRCSRLTRHPQPPPDVQMKLPLTFFCFKTDLLLQIATEIAFLTC